MQLAQTAITRTLGRRTEGRASRKQKRVYQRPVLVLVLVQVFAGGSDGDGQDDVDG